jgi:hypothetical protein
VTTPTTPTATPTVTPAAPASPALCHTTCTFARLTREHHDRLRAIEADVDGVLDLFELALTWAELDYSRATLISPAQWSAFVDCHEWRDPEKVRRIFDLATDVALRSHSMPLELPLQLQSVGRAVGV